MNSSDAIPFASGHTRARLVMGFLMAGIVLDIVAMISGLFQISLLSNIVSGSGTYTEDEVFWNDLREGAIAILQVFVYITTVVLFLMWIHRAYRNLPALGARILEFSPGWAVGWFFIPFANLFYPYRVVKEIWNKSDPEVDDTESFLWQSAGTPPFIGWWWGFWVVSNIVNNLVFRFSMRADAPDELLLLSKIELFAHVLNAAAAALAILVVKGIDERQEERSKRFLPINSPPPPPVFRQSSDPQS